MSRTISGISGTCFGVALARALLIKLYPLCGRRRRRGERSPARVDSNLVREQCIWKVSGLSGSARFYRQGGFREVSSNPRDLLCIILTHVCRLRIGVRLWSFHHHLLTASWVALIAPDRILREKNCLPNGTLRLKKLTC